jgi:hypothetical protein
VLSNVGLVEDLRASRQRLVTAQDEARRRLERNIHDGAQQDLVALAIKLRLAATTVDDDPARQILGELQTDAAGALQNLRDLARGIYPPLLADLGLAAALSAKASKSALPVAVEAGGIGRFPQDTEAALYFCCLEALQNTARYAQASEARICLQAENGNLRFTVSDDGTGYDTRHTPMGSGLRNMADWLAALGASSRSGPPQPGHHHHRAPAPPRHQRRSLARQSPMAPDATKTVGKGGLRKQQPSSPTRMPKRRRRRRGSRKSRAKHRRTSAAERLICASLLPWAWRPPPPLSAGQRARSESQGRSRTVSGRDRQCHAEPTRRLRFVRVQPSCMALISAVLAQSHLSSNLAFITESGFARAQGCGLPV